MAMLSIEQAQGVLWLAGNVMPSQEQKLNQALSRYLEDGGSDDRVVDMSAVKYLSSYAAKTVLAVAQEARERGWKLKVRSSLPVERTLTLLGAQSWCEVESCRKPNRWPGAASGSRSKVRREYSARIIPPKRDGMVRVNSLSRADSIPPALESPEETLVAMAELDTHSTNVEGALVEPTQAEVDPQASVSAASGQPLVSDGSYLPEDLSILRTLVVMKTYSFQMMGVKTEVTGRVLERVGGPWILIDSHGAKKMVNVRKAMAIDVLT
jgi:anti-anti-sigma regulatory factor